MPPSTEAVRRRRKNETPLGNRPLAFIGFMGVGKSAIGKRVAALMDYRYVDTDTLVEKHAGKPIADIFRDEGEKYFRALESEMLTQAVGDQFCVISTGGGLPSVKANRDLLMREAAVVLLTAQPEVILKRVQPLGKRPLLVGYANPLERIHELLEARKDIYSYHHYAIDTSLSRPLLVARRIVKWYQSLERNDTDADRSR